MNIVFCLPAKKLILFFTTLIKQSGIIHHSTSQKELTSSILSPGKI